jgi:phosphoglycerate dehydrogenase-like enzyme
MTLLVLASPQAAWLHHLRRLPAATRIVAGNTPDAFPPEARAEARAVAVAAGCGGLLKEMWPDLKRLEWVHSLAAGLENVLFPELVDSPIPLTNAKGVFARSLGEFALAGMLYFAKHLERMRNQQKAGEWRPFDVDELHGATLGVIGYGSIGRAAAEKALTFGMHVLGIGSSATQEELEETLRAADYLLVSAPLTSDTRAMLGAAEIALLKPHCVVINLGRGPVIVELALIEALQQRRIRGAVLDVFDHEPLPAGHPFWTMDNVLMSPHCADNTATWMDDALNLFVDNFDNWTNGGELMNLVDKRSGY